MLLSTVTLKQTATVINQSIKGLNRMPGLASFTPATGMVNNSMGTVWDEFTC